MSTTIDERVVEMRFDNKHFENNVSTTMSTLDKLKQKLNLSGASKGLENVSASARKVDLSPVSRSAETVGLKFNAMYTIADQALRNITNSAMSYGKKMISALTIDPVKTGFQEYELKMNSVQTIMASTGETIDTVNKYLEELNKYSDMTIYSFSDMTSNIGKFTNAGVKLEDAVAAIKGISNEAALSGANANEASRAMYNFSQALSAGYVKLIDWKSIENANMATMGFKEELIKTALELGTVTEAADGMYKTLTGKSFNATKNFNDVLQEQWMTSEVLIETLKKYADAESEIGSKATEAATKVKTFTQLWDTLKEAAQSGWAKSWELLIGNLEQAKELLTSISKVVGGFIDRTSDWRNTLLEGVLGSPFARIKDLLENSGLGALDEYTNKISNLADMLEYYQEVVSKVWRGDYNNRGDNPDRFDLLIAEGYDPHIVQNLVNLGAEHALTVEDLEAAYAKWGKTAEGTAETTEKIAIDLENLNDEQLRNMGFTEAEIRLFRELQKQAKAAGKSLSEFLEERASMTGRQMLIDSLKGIARVLGEIGAAIGKAWEAIFNPAGLTDEEKMSNYIITLYTALTKFYNFASGLSLTDETAQKLTRTFKGLFALLDIVTTILSGGFKIAFKVLREVLSYFNIDILDITANIGDAIVGFHDWLDSLFNISAVLDVVVPWIEETIKWFRELGEEIAASDEFKEFKNNVSELLNAVVPLFERVGGLIRQWHKDIASSEALKTFKKYLTKALVTLRNFITEFASSEELKNFARTVKEVAIAVAKWIAGLANVPGVKEFLGFIKSFIGGISNWIAELREADDVGKYIIKGIVIGLLSAANAIWDLITGVGGYIIEGLIVGIGGGAENILGVILNIGRSIVEAIKEFFGIHSPSVVMMVLGGFIVAGLVSGINGGSGEVFAAIKDLSLTVINMIKGLIESITRLDAGTIIAAAITTGIVVAVVKVADAIRALGGPLGELGLALSSIGKGFKNYLNAQAVQTLAISIAILVGSLLALAIFMNTSKNPDAIWEAVGVLAALTGIVAVLAGIVVGLNAIGSKADGNMLSSVKNIILPMIIIAGSMLILAIALKKISEVDDPGTSLGIMATMAVGMLAIAFILGSLAKPAVSEKIGKAGIMMLGLSAALLTMVMVVKISSKITGDEIWRGIAVITTISLLFAAIIAVSMIGSKTSIKIAGMVGLAIAIGMMVMVVKLAAKLDDNEISRGMDFVWSVGILFAAIIAVTSLTGAGTQFVGGMLLKMSLAMLLMVGIFKLANKVTGDEIKGALDVIAGIGILFAGLIYMSHFAGPFASQAGSMLIKLSVALLILAGVTFIFGMIKPEALENGLFAVTMLSIIMGILIKVTSTFNAGKGVVGSLVTLAVIITLMVGSVVVLATLDPTRLAVATLAVVGMIGMFALLVLSMKTLEKIPMDWKSVGKVVMLTAVVAALGALIAHLSNFTNPDSAIQTAVALGILLISLSGAMAILGATKPLNKGVILSMAGLGAVVAELAVALAIVSDLNPKASIKNAIALGALLLAMSVSMLVLDKIVVFNKSIIGAMAGLAAVLLILGVALAIMKNLDPDQSIAHATALSVLLVVLTGVAAALSLFGNLGSGMMVGIAGVALLVVLTALVATILLEMKDLDPESSIAYANALATLMIALTAVAGALAIVGHLVVGMALGLVGLYVLIEMTETVVDIIRKLSKINVDNANKSVGTLVTLLSSLGDLMVKVSSLGWYAVAGAIGLAALESFVVKLGIIAVAVGYLASKWDGMGDFIDSGFSVLTKLTEGIGSMLGSLFSGFTQSAVKGLPEFSDALAQLVEAVKSTGEINLNDIDGVRNLSKALDQLGSPETTMAIMRLVAADFDGLGDKLSEFFKAISGFLDNMSKYGIDTMTGVGHLANFIDALGNIVKAFKRIDSAYIESFNTNFKSLVTGISEGLSEFKTAISDSGITEDDCKILGTVGDAIASMVELTNAIPDSILDRLKALVLFTSSFEEVADSFKSIKTTLGSGGWTDEDTAMVERMATTIQHLTTASGTIQNEGGVLSWIIGDNTLGMFAQHLPTITASLAMVKATMANWGTTWTEDDTEMMQNIATAVNSLAVASQDIENQGLSLASIFVGDNTLSDFAEEIATLGSKMAEFKKNIGSWSDDDTAMISGIADAIGAMITVASTVTGDSNFHDLINSAAFLAMVNGLPTIGKNIKGFIENVGSDFSESAASNMLTAAEAIKTLSDSKFTISKVDGLAAATEKLPNIATCIKEFANSMALTSADSITNCHAAVSSIIGDIGMVVSSPTSIATINANAIKETAVSLSSFIRKLSALYNTVGDAEYVVETVKNLIDGLTPIDTSGAEALANAIGEVADSIVDSFTTAFTRIETTHELTKSVESMVDTVISAISEESESMKTAFTTLVSIGASAIGTEEQYTSYSTAGAWLARGLIAGINSKSSEVWQAGYELGKLADAGFRAAGQINSPSKVFYKLGSFLTLGLTNALYDSEDGTYDAAFNVGRYAEKGLSDAISRVRMMIDSGIDTQPTIKPVLDLSDVKSGVGAMNNLLGIGSSRAVLADVGAINTTMNRRSQNGGSDEVVSAIDKLRKDLGNVGNTNYNINGLSYSGDAELDSAFKTIVRVARIGKRV